MRARLLLSVAVATLSLCISQGYAQNAGQDPAGGEAAKPGQSENAANRGHEAARKAHEQRGERAQKRERDEAKAAKESERQGVAEPEKQGETAKNAKDEERRGKPGMDENRGQKGAKHGAKRESPARPGAETHGAKEPDAQDRTGRAESSQGERAGEARRDEDRRGARNETDRAPRPMEQRGETDRDRQQGRDVFGRSPEADRMRGEDRETLGRTDQDEQQRAARRDERGGMRLSARDQSRVRDIIERRGERSVSRNEFDVRIGAVAPPNVQFYPLPPEVVAIAPQYRGYDFVRVEDQIAIIDPGDRQVVAMLGEGGEPPAMYGYEERGGGGGYERREGGRYGSARRDEGYQGRAERRGEAYGYAPRVRLDNRQERALYRGVMQEARTNLRQVCVRVGDRVPEFVDIEPVPRQIAADTPDVARFDYFVLNDQVVLVDPDSRKVVDIIEEPR
ncbi:DUF1236 domain-containing protein [Methylocystis sp. JAN1]|uniref:DUF1236 domain-containing protein n=1 Tax=Methylocystis sp. JAN1 TaxID=3397211 RepID=UPI003FA337EA